MVGGDEGIPDNLLDDFPDALPDFDAFSVFEALPDFDALPAIRCPRSPRWEDTLEGVGVDNLPNHVELSTVSAPTDISRAYGCGQRFAGTFTDTSPDVYSDAEFKSIINDKLMESFM